MKGLLRSRSVWFLAERAISQGGGLVFTAVLARVSGLGEASSFVAAYALASLFQPLFANACQPLAMRLWRDAGPGAVLALWGGLQVVAAITFVVLLTFGGPMQAIFGIVLAAPLSLMAAPLIAEDRWRDALSVLIPVGVFGVVARLMALLAGDIALAAALFAFEPVVGGFALARRSGLFRTRPYAPSRVPFLRSAVSLMCAMGAATLFWRAPVLLAEGFLTPVDVLHIAFAAQIVAGFMLAPNALIQAQFGRMTTGGARRKTAIGAGVRVSLAAGLIAIPISALAGEALMSFVYGPKAMGAGAILVALSPMVALGGIWRITEFLASHDSAGGALLFSRLVAIVGMALTGAWIVARPDPVALAAGASLSLAVSALIFPLCSSSLRPFILELAEATAAIWTRPLKIS